MDIIGETMKHKPLPNLSILQECFTIAADGTLIWKIRPLAHFRNGAACRRWNTRYAGAVAGFLDNMRGYWKVCVDDVQYQASRIIFMLINGIDPAANLVDHHDIDKLNNTPGNLRLTDKSGNAQNASIRADNASGVKGVVWRKDRSRWRARVIRKGERRESLFDDLTEAAEWVQTTRAEMYGEFARHA